MKFNFFPYWLWRSASNTKCAHSFTTTFNRNWMHTYCFNWIVVAVLVVCWCVFSIHSSKQFLHFIFFLSSSLLFTTYGGVLNLWNYDSCTHSGIQQKKIKSERTEMRLLNGCVNIDCAYASQMKPSINLKLSILGVHGVFSGDSGPNKLSLIIKYQFGSCGAGNEVWKIHSDVAIQRRTFGGKNDYFTNLLTKSFQECLTKVRRQRNMCSHLHLIVSSNRNNGWKQINGHSIGFPLRMLNCRPTNFRDA